MSSASADRNEAQRAGQLPLKPNWRYLKRVNRDTRTPDELTEHFLLERSLARRLLNAPASERLALYGPLYDELYASLPNHPRFTRRLDPGHAGKQLAVLKRLVHRDDSFLEIGAGDASVSFAMSEFCREVVALDVTDRAVLSTQRPSNFRFVLSDGINFPLESGSVNFAYSNQLMEHLHPEDAEKELGEIFRVLRPGGRYFCITPSRLTGPHDISRYFTHQACGFHLKEWSYRELGDLFRGVGFGRIRACFTRGGHYAGSLPVQLLTPIERLAETLPPLLCERIGTNHWIGVLFGLAVLAEKPDISSSA
jgi:SAM-dependent methyltransferase